MFNQLTKKDIEDMQAEIENRKVVLRPKLLEAVKEARAHGDLSENFEYYAAKKEKNKNESRIRFLERMIKTADIIEDNSASDEVGVNDTVEIVFEEDKTSDSFTIVSTMRGDSLKNLVSVESPIGKALLGHKVDERVEVIVNKDVSYFVKIVKISKDNLGENAALRGF